jgi:hypothetical protein
MPRRISGERLEKVVSTTVTQENYMLLEKYARIAYNQNKVAQPTISHFLRKMISQWMKVAKKRESESTNDNLTPQNKGPTYKSLVHDLNDRVKVV